MKKLLALLLAIIMLLSLCACDAAEEEEEENDKPKTTAGEEKESPEEDDEEENKNKDSKEEDEEEETEPKIKETEPKIEETEPVKEPEDDTVNIFGTIKRNRYENAYIGFGMKLDDSWYCYTDEELSELNGFAMDRLGGDYMEILENGSVVYDLFVQRRDNTDNICINMEKVAPVQLINFDNEKNLELLVPTMREMYEAMGCSKVTCEVETVIIDGEEFACIYTDAVMAGNHICQIMIQKPCKEHIAAVTFTALDWDDMEEYLDMLYVVD